MYNFCLFIYVFNIISWALGLNFCQLKNFNLSTVFLSMQCHPTRPFGDIKIIAIFYPPRILKFGSAAKRIGSVVHLLVLPTQILCSNPGHQSKGHHVPLRWCPSWGSSPALGTATRGGSTLLFWWRWLEKSRATNHGNSRRSLCIAAAILIGR